MSGGEFSAMVGAAESADGASRDAAYRQGFQDGLAAVTAPERKRIEVLEALLQQLVDEKARLADQVRQLGEQLAAHDAAFDACLKEEIDYLHRRAASAEVELSSLRRNLTTLDDSLAQRSRQYVTQAWLYNSCRVFMGATRKVLESLLQEESDVSGRVRTLFARNYTEQVQDSLEKGMIKAAPDSCPDFAEAMPATRKFILELLRTQRSK